MNEKLISIIIPCYNVEKWLDRCVFSLVKQTIGIENLELIFVDDASTDGTLARLEMWEKRYPDSICVVACAKNGRQGTARNIGLSYASAAYIGFADSDDWAEKDMYEILYRKMIKNQVDVVCCMQGRDQGDGILRDIKKFSGPVDQKIIINTKEDRHNFLKYGLPGGVYTKLYRRGFLLEKDIMFPEQMTYEDIFFGMLVQFEASSVYIADKVLYHYFYNVESTITVRNSKHQLDRFDVEEQLLTELRKRKLYESFYKEICEYCIKIFYLNSLHMIFTRFDALLMQDLERAKRIILEHFPDWAHVICTQEFSAVELGFLQTLKENMTEKKWENLKNNYLFLVENKADCSTRTVRC